MSFKADNTYFIKLELISKLRGLSKDERSKYYCENLRLQFRNKLRNSYYKTANVSDFYNEAFEVLQEFEHEFLFINLFFEPNQHAILNKLDKSFFQGLTTQYGFLKNYANHAEKILNVRDYQDSDFEGFLIDEFEVFADISIRNVTKNDRSQNALPHGFASWLIENLQNENCPCVIVIFARIWQIYFSKPFDSIKALVLLNDLLNGLREDSNLHHYIDKASNLVNELFSEKVSLPIIDNKEYILGSSNGYKMKKKQFDDLLASSRLLNTNYLDISYSELFNIYSRTTNNLLKQKLTNSIILKRESGIFPSKNDLEKLQNNLNDNEFCEMFNKAFYLYQNLDFK